MRKLWLGIAVAITALGMAQADLAVVREDIKDGRKPALTVGVVTPQLEAWGFSLPTFPIWEVGRTEHYAFGKRASVLAGGYLSFWQNTRQWYVEPWSCWRTNVGTTQFSAKVAAYAPLNGGGWWLYSDQTAVTWPVGKGFRLGIATDWWLCSGAKPTAGVGPVLSIPLGKSTLSLRALLGHNEADAVRTELVCPF